MKLYGLDKTKNNLMFWNNQTKNKPSYKYLKNNIFNNLQELKANVENVNDFSLQINTDNQPYKLLALDNSDNDYWSFWILRNFEFNGLNYTAFYEWDAWTTCCVAFQKIAESKDNLNLNFYTKKATFSKATFDKLNPYFFNGSNKPLNQNMQNFIFQYQSTGNTFANNLTFWSFNGWSTTPNSWLYAVVKQQENFTYSNLTAYPSQFGLAPLKMNADESVVSNGITLSDLLNNVGNEFVDIIALPFSYENLTNNQDSFVTNYNNYCDNSTIASNKQVIVPSFSQMAIYPDAQNNFWQAIKATSYENMWTNNFNNIIEFLKNNSVYSTGFGFPQFVYYLPQLSNSLSTTIKYNSQTSEITNDFYSAGLIKENGSNFLPQLYDLNNYFFTLLMNAPEISIVLEQQVEKIGKDLNRHIFNFWNSVGSIKGASATFLNNYKSIINTSHKIMTNNLTKLKNDAQLNLDKAYQDNISVPAFIQDFFNPQRIGTAVQSVHNIKQNYAIDKENMQLEYSLNFGQAKLQELKHEQERQVGNGSLTPLTALLLAYFKFPSLPSFINYANDFYHYGYEIDDLFNLQDVSYNNNLFWYLESKVDWSLLNSIINLPLLLTQAQKQAWETQIDQGVRVWNVKPFVQNLNTEEDWNNWQLNGDLI